MHKFGRLVLNKIPENNHRDVETSRILPWQLGPRH